MLRLLPAMLLLAAASGVAAQSGADAALLERGRYMVLTGHCNNCHTAGYAPTNGRVPEEKWLMGNPVGWRSKSGTTYGTNLRLYVANLSEDAWIQVIRNAEPRAPMPWWSLRATSDDDLRAMYRYIRSLQPLGNPAPAFLPPGEVPPRPYQQLPDMS